MAYQHEHVENTEEFGPTHSLWDKGEEGGAPMGRTDAFPVRGNSGRNEGHMNNQQTEILGYLRRSGLLRDQASLRNTFGEGPPRGMTLNTFVVPGKEDIWESHLIPGEEGVMSTTQSNLDAAQTELLLFPGEELQTDAIQPSLAVTQWEHGSIPGEKKQAEAIQAVTQWVHGSIPGEKKQAEAIQAVTQWEHSSIPGEKKQAEAIQAVTYWEHGSIPREKKHAEAIQAVPQWEQQQASFLKAEKWEEDAQCTDQSSYSRNLSVWKKAQDLHAGVTMVDGCTEAQSRSDASYPPNPLYLMRESVMSLDPGRESSQNFPGSRPGSHESTFPQPPEGGTGPYGKSKGPNRAGEQDVEGVELPAYQAARQRHAYFDAMEKNGEAQVPFVEPTKEKLDSQAFGQSQAAAGLPREAGGSLSGHSNHSQGKDSPDFVRHQTQEKNSDAPAREPQSRSDGPDSSNNHDRDSSRGTPTNSVDRAGERDGDRHSSSEPAFQFEGPPPSLDDLKQTLATEETPVASFLPAVAAESLRNHPLYGMSKSPPTHSQDFQLHNTSTPNKESSHPDKRDHSVFNPQHQEDSPYNPATSREQSFSTTPFKRDNPFYVRTPSMEHSLFSPSITPSKSPPEAGRRPPSADSRPFYSQDSRELVDISTHSNSGSSGHSLSPSPLDSHVEQDHNGRDVFFCHLCSYVGTSNFHFQAHMSSHFEHACPHCDYKSRTEGRLKRHIKDFHSDDPPDNFSGQKTMRTPGRPKIFKCKQCDFMSTTKVEFWEHARSHIKDDKVLQCPKCPFVTEYKHHLEYHLRNHFGSKPFKCPKCNYACVNKSMLNSHMKSHTNVYQYRCADCTYATKYCHSLKLHLRKYAHKPATVLNSDGSLPTDGSGDFDLVSKRGPPRGPRGPRKDMGEPGFPPGMPMMNPGLPLFPGLGAPHLPNGAMAGMFPFWPMLGGLPNGLKGPPPLIPVPGMNMNMNMNPLSIHVPHGDAKMQPGGSLTPHSNPGIRCVLCDFTADNRGRLNDHMLKVHASEHPDLAAMFGLRPDLTMDGVPIKTEKTGDGFEREEHKGSKPLRPEAASPKSADVAGWPGSAGPHGRPEPPPQQMSPKAPLPPHIPPQLKERYNMAVAADLAACIEAEARINGECPLDLTKATKPQEFGGYESFGPSSNSSEAMDYTPGQKRSHDDSGVSPGEPASDPAQSSSSTSPTPRKRSRKGKAYKLDTICMKLQERYGDSPTHDDDDVDESGEAYLSDYNSDRANGDMSSQEIGEHAMGVASKEDQEEADEGIRQEQLDPEYNSQHGDQGTKSRQGEANGDDSGTDDCPPPQSRPEVVASFSNSINRRKLFISRRPEERTHYRGMNGHRGDEGNNSSNTEQSVHAALLQAGLNKAGNHGNTYECNHCEILFRDCIMYTMHMGYHGYRDPFKCNMCGHCAKDKVEFFLHIARAAHA